MDDVSALNQNDTDAARSGLLYLHPAAREREPIRLEVGLSPNELLTRFRAADPTRKLSYLPWLLRTYACGGYRLEDLSKAHDTLAAFARLRKQLPKTANIDGKTRNPRKLSSHVTLASLCSVIAPLVEAEQVVREAVVQVDVDRERALAQSRILLRSDRMVVAVPMTQEASWWWGKGTKWYTAVRKNKAFEWHNSNAPLIVICLQKVDNLPARKLQLHVYARGMHLVDENDERVSPELISERWQDFEALLHWAVGRNAGALEHVPEPLRTEAICITAVTEYEEAMQYVPAHRRTKAVCLAAVKRDGTALQDVPEPLRTKEMCLAAVGRDGMALAYVPEPLRTKEMCLAAVGSNGLALEDVPEPLCTKAMCLAAVEQNGKAIVDVPERLCTEAMCLAAVGSNGEALQYLSERLRTEAICLAAVGSNGEALLYVPEHLRTETICTVAVAQNERSLNYVPERIRLKIRLAMKKQEPALVSGETNKHKNNDSALEGLENYLKTYTVIKTISPSNQV